MVIPKTFVGVDWSSDGWLAVVFDDEGYQEVRIEPRIEDIWEAYGPEGEFVVDIPIGLCSSTDDANDGCREDEDGLFRICDDLARKAVGWPRTSSVFTPPAREIVIEIANYNEETGSDAPNFSKMNDQITGKGLSNQSINFAPQIMEVDELLRETGDMKAVVESHPEVCFRAFKGAQLHYSKHSAAGVDERLDALNSVPEHEEGLWRDIAFDLREKDGNPGIDDLLDAIALGLTAVGKDEWLSLPPGGGTDSEGRPMQIVYRADEPLEEIRKYYGD